MRPFDQWQSQALTCYAAASERRGDMKRIIYSTLLAPAAALAGCDQSDETTSNNDSEANAAAPVFLPPSISAQKA